MAMDIYIEILQVMCHHRCARFCFSRCETSVQRRRAHGGHRSCSYRGKNWPGKVPWGPWRLESTMDGHVALLCTAEGGSSCFMISFCAGYLHLWCAGKGMKKDQSSDMTLFNPGQALSNTLWSFANLECWHRPLKEWLAQGQSISQLLGIWGSMLEFRHDQAAKGH